jgi:hypothetical protein
MMMNSTWEKVMAMESKDKRHSGLANNLTIDELQCVLGTIDFFGGRWQADSFDLQVPKYRVFDWLAMRVQGRGGPSEQESTKVLVYSFLKVDGDIDKWLNDLQTTDYDIDEKWRELELTV